MLFPFCNYLTVGSLPACWPPKPPRSFLRFLRHTILAPSGGPALRLQPEATPCPNETLPELPGRRGAGGAAQRGSISTLRQTWPVRRPFARPTLTSPPSKIQSCRFGPYLEGKRATTFPFRGCSCRQAEKAWLPRLALPQTVSGQKREEGGALSPHSSTSLV